MKCALCNRESSLQDSHLIPKLVYTRIKSHPNSRFRSLDDIFKVMQDGEKHKMLCHDCEEKFSVLETYFAKHFLDIYLSGGIIPEVDDQTKLGDYILSVAWRILWDDLYRMNSFSDHIRDEFERFESDLHDYLLNHNSKQQSKFLNRIWRLKDLINCPQSLEESTLFGYSYYPNALVGCLVLVYYAGLLFVTQYVPDRSILIIDGIDSIETEIDQIICDEMTYKFNEILKEEKEKITPELSEKITRRYGK